MLLESEHSTRVYNALLYEESYRKPVDFVYGLGGTYSQFTERRLIL